MTSEYRKVVPEATETIDLDEYEFRNKIEECTKFVTFKFWPFQEDRYLFENDYNRLADGQYLTDYTLEFFIKHLQSKYTNRKLDVFIFETESNLELKKENFTGSEFTTILTTLNVNVFTMDYLVFPLNHNAHWYLGMIRNPCFALCESSTVSFPEILFLNSYILEDKYRENIAVHGQDRQYLYNTYAKNLRLFLEMEAYRLYSKVISLDRFAIPAEDVKVAQQSNTSDCGCYLLMFVEELLKRDESGVNLSLLSTNHIVDARLMRTKISYLIQNQLLQHSINNDVATELLMKLPAVDLPDISRVSLEVAARQPCK